MNEEKSEKSEILRIRAREGATRCAFLPLEGCSARCGFNDGEACTLLADVPAGEDPQDWHARMLAAARAALEGGAA